MEMLDFVLSGFRDEIEKIADLIPPAVFSKLDDYDKNSLVEARDAITLATDKKSKLSTAVRASVIEAALDKVKNRSHSLANSVQSKGKLECKTEPCSPDIPRKVKKL